MSLIIKPSSIRFHGKHGHYMYNCPKCKLTLTRRIGLSKLVKILFFWLSLKKYKCQSCMAEYHVYARQYVIKSTPSKIELALELEELSPAYDRIGGMTFSPLLMSPPKGY
jgi:hypothetical protein